MRYPEKLIDKLERVKEIHRNWNSSIPFEDVVNWILQFDSEDYKLAIRIIEHINFLNFADIKNSLAIAYSKLIRKSIEKGTKITHRNTLFAGLGENGKSGSMISYHFRVINELSEENFSDNDVLIESGNIENIVLIDDILSTGHQATKEINKLTEKVTPSGVNNIFLLTVCGMKDGIRKVEEETKAYTFSAIEYSTKDTIIDLDGKFYEGFTYEERERIKKRIEYYGKIAYPKQPFGFGQIGSLIAFDFNTPNTSLPIIWSDNNSWIPLFKRARRINGIQSYYKQFEKSKKEKITFDNKNKSELTIYVEGKIEEVFFDLLIQEKNLVEILGYEKVNVVSLGGAIMSEKLLIQLLNEKQEQVFIFEDDMHIRRIIEREPYNNLKVVLMGPNIMSFFNIKDIIKLEKNDKQLDEMTNGMEVTDKLYFDIEMLLIKKRTPTQRFNILKEYISKYFNNEMFDNFIKEVKAKLNNDDLE
ncbi:MULTISPECIES: phosphoribosyltransferase-like protein [Bacillus]|uniref:phosphoribosyltransferase-like protein n=1 Tax=Bacillus TaxID=1386 RepID=UPI0011A7E484|nr:hypothetical protein [Bacillus subtilis]MBU8610694.1 hypothetical protein [Bacillus subtilis]MBU8717741.1 hypothetical protein [Bacillus subtilis]MBU8748862.1 hypothetical protein [Bacillus subtilis]MED1935413.1 hypothetical protein [Bacillus subtilis]TWG62892.1 hypothetical protein L608_000100009340 [Bacillus subtilis J23]